MCYHVSVPDTRRIEIELPEYKVDYNWDDPIYHVSGFMRPFLPVTLNKDIGTIVGAQWKLLPFWVKNEEAAKKYANTLNAEAESIFEKASYRHYITKKRGLLWVNGFFEPHKNVTTGNSENYYIYKPDRALFSIGIVYSPWTNEDTGEIINTFSVITTKANPLLEKIHNEKKRMPLIIAPENRDYWLKARSKENVESLMQPYGGEFAAHKVHRVTADRTGDTNRPDIQEPID